jgi:hypothetical protein
MTDPSIPLLAYGFIGITTLVLAYATFMDTGPDNKSSSGTSSFLPTLSSTTTSPSIPVAQPIQGTPTNSIFPQSPQFVQATSNPLGPSPPQLKIGGKTKRRHRNKHKRTKSRH